MYLSGLTTATDASSPVSMPLSNVQIWSFLFEVMDSYASLCTANANINGLTAGRFQLHALVMRYFAISCAETPFIRMAQRNLLRAYRHWGYLKNRR